MKDTQTSDVFKSGFVALVGRPNAGKSTLTNAVVGKKVAITSATPQTTRSRLRAVLDRPDMQLILVDTPGLHKPHDVLGEELNLSACKSLEDVDAVAMLVDATKPIGKGDAWVAEQVNAAHSHKILVITKADLSNETEITNQITRAQRLMTFEDVVVLSAVEGFNIDGFVECVAHYLPEGPRWFPEGMGIDQPLEVLIAEFIREKILRLTHDEVPHSVGVLVEDLEYNEKRDLTRITATIFAERASQKGILIGKGGEMVKRIGTEARHDLEHLLATAVHLDLQVKVKRDWRRDMTQIHRFGYGTGL